MKYSFKPKSIEELQPGDEFTFTHAAMVGYTKLRVLTVHSSYVPPSIRIDREPVHALEIQVVEHTLPEKVGTVQYLSHSACLARMAHGDFTVEREVLPILTADEALAMATRELAAPMIDQNVARVASILIDTNESIESAAIKVYGELPPMEVQLDLEAALVQQESIVRCSCGKWVSTNRIDPITETCYACRPEVAPTAKQITACGATMTRLVAQNEDGVVIRALVFNEYVVQRYGEEINTSLTGILPYVSLAAHLRWLETGESQ